MQVFWTEAAGADLDQTLAYTGEHYPLQMESVERRIRAVIERIALWPEGAREVEARPGVRVVPLVRYPYRVFYRVAGGQVEILHLHHAARDERST